jgi:hypothetical protein
MVSYPKRAMQAALLVLVGGCQTADLGETPTGPGRCSPNPDYFEDVIWPMYIDSGDPATSCVDGRCHNSEIGVSSFRVSTAEPIDFASNYEVVTYFLNCATPEASELLTEPLGGVESHGGGELFAPGSAAEDIFLDWFISN